jgi:hypothetical protein
MSVPSAKARQRIKLYYQDKAMKPLGQIAYETFMRSRNPDAPEAKWVRWWPALSPQDQAHWQECADMVIGTLGLTP